MNTPLNRTLDPVLLSWVASANDPATDCERPGLRRIGFGDCSGTLLSAR